MRLNCFHIKIKILALVMAMTVVLLSLGVWQMERLAWKENLIATIEKAKAQPAEALPSDISLEDQKAYQKFYVRGRFSAPEIILPLKQENGVHGAHVITAFETEDQQILFVNRGFLPTGQTAQAPAKGDVTIQGVLRPDDQGNRFSLQNDVQKKLFYRLKLDDFKTLLPQGAKMVPYVMILTAKADGDSDAVKWPRPLQEPYPLLRNNHFDYAVFWFTMAGILWAIFLISSYQKGGRHD